MPEDAEADDTSLDELLRKAWEKNPPRPPLAQVRFVPAPDIPDRSAAEAYLRRLAGKQE